MTDLQAHNLGIGPATPVSRIWRMWQKLKANALTDRCSVRVFEGHLYSLMDDETYYEESGNRKLINGILFDWDAIRKFALKDEEEQGWGSRIAKRTEEEQETIYLMAEHLDLFLRQLKERS